MLPKPIKDDYKRNITLTVDTNVAVPMRDGTILYGDVYRPAGNVRVPVLLHRLPYGKHTPRYRSLYLDPVRAVNRGYAVVVQDTRGRHMSEGTFYPYRHEATDGFDTVEWCAAQQWCDGNVGMFGISYHGATQWLAAGESPPSLKAIIPGVTSDDYYDSWTYLGGAFQLFWTAGWAGSFAVNDIGNRLSSANLDVLRQWLRDPHAMSGHLPLQEMPALRGVADYYYDWLAHPTYDDYWKSFAPKEKFKQIKVPALNWGGWYDGFIRGSIRCYQGMRDKGESELSRKQQHLIIGPWLHGPSPPAVSGQGYFGSDGSGDAIDLHGMQLSWFDHWLKGEDNGVDTDPNTYIFMMGENTWRSEESWPPPSVQTANYFLRSRGKANSLNGDGILSMDPPKAGETPDRYMYNPLNPVPTNGGAHLAGIPSVFNVGVQDQRSVEMRSDVLVYTSDPLEKDTEITGHVTLNLWAVTSASDTDWTAKLVDVHPNGLAVNVCDGILKARFRNSLTETSLVEPDNAYLYRIDVGPTSMLFKRGHSIRLEVSSSNFPAYARNLNTGGTHDIELEPLTTIQTILHDADHQSVLELPIVM